MEHVALWERLGSARMLDLSQPTKAGMPVSPSQPPYSLLPFRRHGDVVRADAGSAASEVIVTGGHVGTHIDALGHVSHEGKLFGGLDASSAGTHLGLAILGADQLPLIACRGLFLDIGATLDTPRLAPGYEITVSDLVAAADRAGGIQAGDAVLIGSGWSDLWDHPTAFVGSETGAPGIGPEAAQWLAGQKVGYVGGETLTVEVIQPGAGHALLPVHRILLVESGIPMIECMNLEPLHELEVGEFSLLALPLKLAGASGSPVRPVALLDD